MYILVSLINGKETCYKHGTMELAIHSGLDIVVQFLEKQSELERLYIKNLEGEIVWSHSFDEEPKEV